MAKQGVGLLFESEEGDKLYDAINTIQPHVAYELFLLERQLDRLYKNLSKKKIYFRSLKGHITFALFSLVVQLFNQARVQWGEPALTKTLELALQSDPDSMWKSMTTGCVQLIHSVYKEVAKSYQKEKGKPLSSNNFFRTRPHVRTIFDSPKPKKLKALSRKILARQ